MKLERKQREIFGGIGKKSITASISEQDMDKLWEAIENPYKNPISSIVREYTSNCFDAHVDAGVNDAVRIKFGRNESGYYISFIDVGTGMSPELMENIFTKVYASTKENSNIVVGAFGIGSKSGLSYNDFFEIITRFDGIEYKYIYAKGEVRPTLDLIEDIPTTERNGTEIRISIKNNEDVKSFVDACHKQLYYFTNVVYDYQELLQHLPNYNITGFLYRYDSHNEILNKKYVEDRLDNDFIIQEGKHFKIRLNKRKGYTEYDLSLHMVNGPVKYPIDTGNIKTAFINKYHDLPIALKFDIGDLDVIQTREDVKYTKKTIDAIKQKCIDVEKELDELFDQQNLIKSNDPSDIFSKNIYVTDSLNFGKNNYDYSYNYYDRKGDIHYAPINNIDVNQTAYFKSLFNRIGFVKMISKLDNGRIKTNNFDGHYKNSNISDDRLLSYPDKDSNRIFNEFVAGVYNDDYKIKIVSYDKDSELLSVKMKKQLLYKEGYDLIITVRDNRYKRTLKDFKSYMLHSKNLASNYMPKKEWRTAITECINAENAILKKLEKDGLLMKESDFVLDKKWFKKFSNDHRKKRGSIDKNKVSINYRDITVKNYGWNPIYATWSNKKDTINNIANSRKFTIFCDKDDKDKLMFIEEIIRNTHASLRNKTLRKYINLNLYSLAPTNYKKLKKEKRNDNVLTYKEFMSNKNNKKIEFLADLHLTYVIKEKYNQLYLMISNDNINIDKVFKYFAPKAYNEYLSIKNKIEPYILLLDTATDQIDKLFAEQLVDTDIMDLCKHDDILDNIDNLARFNNYFYPFFNQTLKNYSTPIDLGVVMACEFKPKISKEFLNPVFMKDVTTEEYKEIKNKNNIFDMTNDDKVRACIYEYKNGMQIKNRTLKL